jgi:hypothetical protein
MSNQFKISGMSRSIFSKTITVCAVSLVGSQSFAQKGFEFGVRYMVQKTALFNSSDKHAGPDLERTSTISYLSGGITGSYNFDRHVAVEVDILYSRQGQSYSGRDIQNSSPTAYSSEVGMQAFLNDEVILGEYQAKAELNCIKIPVLLKLSTDNRKKIYYTVSVGPQVNFIKSVVFEVNKEDVLLPGLDVEPNDVYRKVTLDGVLALGACLKISRHFTLSAQARFDYGFQDVEKKDRTFNYMGTGDQNFYDSNRATTHNATAGLMVGLSYKL